MNITLLHGKITSQPRPEEENKIPAFTWRDNTVCRGSTLGGLRKAIQIKCKSNCKVRQTDG